MHFWLSLPGSEITLPIEPFISVGGGIVIAMVAGGFSLMGIWLNRRLNRLDNQDTPPKIVQTLEEIRRDIGGLREENRTERAERIMLAKAVSKLIEKEK